MKKVTLKNDFHKTEINIVVPENGQLSPRQMRRIRETLCGIKECRCGALYGPQEVTAEFIWDHVNNCETLEIS